MSSNGRGFKKLFYGPGVIVETWVGKAEATPLYTAALIRDLSFDGISLLSSCDGSSFSYGCSYMAGPDLGDGMFGSVESIMFLQGEWNGHPQTFLIEAKRKLVCDQDQNDGPGFSVPQPTQIDVYAFDAGTPKTYDWGDRIEPRFDKIESYLSKNIYASADDAILSEFTIKFSKERTVDNHFMLKELDSNKGKTECIQAMK